MEEGSKSLSIRRRLLSRQLLIGETGWPICCVAQTASLVFLIGFKIALEPFHMTIAFKGEDVGGKTVEEEAVMADDHGAARIVFESVFQGTQRFDVKVVGRLVEQEDIAALLQELRHVNAVALTAGKLADLLLLIATLEIEGPHIGVGLKFMLADGHEIMAAGNFLPDIMVGIQMIAALIDIAELHRIADFDGAAIGRFLAGDKLEQRRLARAVGADHRSEEHPSELQSLMRTSSAVFCLKNKNTTHPSHPELPYNHHSYSSKTQ